MNIKKEVTDQTAHMLGAIIAMGPLMVHPSWFTAMWAGFVIGWIRELTEESSKVNITAFKNVAVSKRSWTDIAFWTFGGFIASLIFM